MRALIWSVGAALVLMAGLGEAQITFWQLGGSGLEWSESDTSQVFIDFATTPGAIQPAYFAGERNILSQRPYWSPFKFPAELDYEDGMIPRVWRAANGFYWYTAGAITTAWVDGDSLTYSPPISRGLGSEWYTYDVGVPVPADRIGFYTPPRGFRADGTPLQNDIFQSFEISISEEFDPVMNQENGDADYHRLETLVAHVLQNYDAHVKIDIPKQYVRFVRFRRLQALGETGQLAAYGGEQSGTIGEFELKGEGVPKRVVVLSRFLDLGREVNFGRLFWQATPMRVVDGVPVEVEDSRAFAKVEVRSGRDGDPNVYHEFTDTGAERVVDREQYEKVLKKPDQVTWGAVQEGKPGLRASITYDQENWTYWSFPITESGEMAPLERGRYLQLRVTLESLSFRDFVRLDSLWIELSPPLARQVFGEVARLDEPMPERGFTEVALGEMVDFTYDLAAEFTTSAQRGFDAVRIRTGSRPQFRRLETGAPLREVTPASVVEEADALVIYLPAKVTRQRNQPLRVVFGTRVFVFANTFTGEVFDTESADLPQQIEAGDASAELGTNSLRVLGGEGEEEAVISELRFSTGVLTPNGDGANDRLGVEYILFRLPAAIPVELSIFSLDATLVRRVEIGEQSAGPQQVWWDGRGEGGKLLPPGLYLVAISLRSEFRIFRHVQPVGLAY